MNYSNIQIRTATADNLTAIQSCAQSAYGIYVERMGIEPAPMVADFLSQIQQGQVQVAFCEETLVGYAVFYTKHDYIHLENIAVAPLYAGKGIGKKLIKYVEHTARNNKLAAVELYTNELMTENLEMYLKLGYVETERKQQDGFNRVFFRKPV